LKKKRRKKYLERERKKGVGPILISDFYRYFVIFYQLEEKYFIMSGSSSPSPNSKSKIPSAYELHHAIKV